MSELFFFLKCFVMALVFIVLLQIRMGDSTLEDRAMSWVRQSSLVQPLQEVAQGGVTVIREGWKGLANKVGSKFNSTFSSDQFPGARSINLQWERSRAALREQVDRAKDHLHNPENKKDSSKSDSL